MIRTSSISSSFSVIMAITLSIVGCSDDGGGSDQGGQGGSSDDSFGSDSNGTSTGGTDGNGGGSDTNDGGLGTSTGGSGMSTGGSGTSTGGGSSTTSSFPDAQTYVDAHNAVRAEVEQPSGYQGNWEALPPVTWSDEVAQSAQQWADNLRDTQNCGLMHATDSGYGENLAGGYGVDASSSVDMWASEKSGYAYSSPFSWNSGVGHYTQIVWRTSTEIGCASAACGSSTVVVCRYSPAGNMIGGEIY